MLQITVELNEQQEKALLFICQNEGGVSEKELQEHLGSGNSDMHQVLSELRGAGFQFNAIPGKINLSTSYVHYDSLMKLARISGKLPSEQKL